MEHFYRGWMIDGFIVGLYGVTFPSLRELSHLVVIQQQYWQGVGRYSPSRFCKSSVMPGINRDG